MFAHRDCSRSQYRSQNIPQPEDAETINAAAASHHFLHTIASALRDPLGVVGDPSHGGGR
jgi:hypothetical protein